MSVMRKKLTAIALAFGAIFGFGIVAAPSASAYTTYYHAHDWCAKKGAYYVGYGWGDNKVVSDWYVHVDYSWSEEVFQGKTDYEYYSHRQRWANSFCTY